MSEGVPYTKVFYFEELAISMLSYSRSSYEALENYEGDLRYQISFSLFTFAHQNHLQLKQIIIDDEDFQRSEFEQLLDAHEKFNHELISYIEDRDTNSSHLYSSLELYKREFEKFKYFIDGLRVQKSMLK